MYKNIIKSTYKATNKTPVISHSDDEDEYIDKLVAPNLTKPKLNKQQSNDLSSIKSPRSGGNSEDNSMF